jgi:ubiquinone biosynthesis protein
MFPSKFIKFMKALNSGKVENLTCVVDLGRAGLRIAEEYSTRFDLLDIEQCLYLSEFQTPTLEKAEKHLLNLIKKNDPLFSLMEYYDNYPYSYSDINYLFKGCLKSGVEISIKAVNPVAKNTYFKRLHKLEQSLKYHSFFMPWLKKKYKIDEILKDLEEHSKEKFSLGNEIRFTKSMEEHLNRHQDIHFLKRVRFPKIYAYLSSDDKVVTEYVYGSYFYELLAYRRLAYKDVLDLIRIQLFFMLKVGVFHNNLHSGNLILSDEGNIHFLDCNTVSVLETETRESIFEVLKSIAKRNFGELAYQINKLSLVKLSEEALENLIADIKFCFSTNTIQNNTLIIKLMKIFRVASNNGIVFNKDVYPIFKSFIYFDKLVEKTRNKNHPFIEDFEKILEELEEIIKNNK